ncbi:MAG: sarcosine oxidase subunit gamma [Hyphomicrobiaceae bacterium]
MEHELRAVSALSGVVVPGRLGHTSGIAGVNVREFAPAVLTSIVAFRGKGDAIAAAFLRDWSIELPLSPRRTAVADMALIWAGPQRWIMSRAPIGEVSVLPRADAVATALDGLAAVVDISASLTLFEIAGSCVRDALAKGVSLDLHPRSFTTGDVALTGVGHIPVHLWQVSDAPAYVMAVPRSLAVSYWNWLVHACAEYGLDVAPAFSRHST